MHFCGVVVELPPLPSHLPEWEWEWEWEREWEFKSGQVAVECPLSTATVHRYYLSLLNVIRFVERAEVLCVCECTLQLIVKSEKSKF